MKVLTILSNIALIATLPVWGLAVFLIQSYPDELKEYLTGKESMFRLIMHK